MILNSPQTIKSVAVTHQEFMKNEYIDCCFIKTHRIQHSTKFTHTETLPNNEKRQKQHYEQSSSGDKLYSNNY